MTTNYPHPGALGLNGANTITFPVPFDMIVRSNECFMHFTGAISGTPVVEIRENGVARAIINVPTDAAADTGQKAVAADVNFPDFAVSAGATLTATVTTTAASGGGRVVLAYDPAVQ